MSKKLSLAESMRNAVQASELPLPPSPAAPSFPVSPASAPKAGFQAATRAGKKKVTAPLAPEDHKRLKRLALDRDATTEALLVEAINDLFAKYGLAEAGQGSGIR